MTATLSITARRLETTQKLSWASAETAAVIVDMWDKTICTSAERRVTELAPRIDAFVAPLRDAGVLIIHAPHSVMNFYRDTPERRRAIAAPYVQAPIPIDWQEPGPLREGPLPVDDADWCDDTPKCRVKEREEAEDWPWTRQIATIQIFKEDAVSDNGQEIFNLFEQRSIRNVILTGVHLNRCVLGRPYGIRQLSMLGKNLVLMRDLTDGLYDPRSRPYVSHEQGVELMVRHVESYWCSSAASDGVSVSSDASGLKPQ